MSQVATLQALAACSIIDNQIYITPFTIPLHLFEDLRILNSIKNLRKEEKYLQHKIEILEKNQAEAVDRLLQVRDDYQDASFWGEEDALALSDISHEYERDILKIEALITECKERNGERNMHEESELSNLSVEYEVFHFRCWDGIHYDMSEDF